MQHHIPNLNASNYLGRYCYPEFPGDSRKTLWKRKIKAYRVRYRPDGFAIPEVKVWQTFGYTWVQTRDIDFIWDYMEESK